MIGTWCARQKPSTWWPSTSLGAVQPFGMRRMIIGQRGRRGVPLRARLLLDRADLHDAMLQRGRHLLMHRSADRRLRRSKACSHSRRKSFSSSSWRDAGKNRGIGDLVAIEMKNRQHRAVANRIEEFIRMPRGRERPGLRLAVADHHGDDQIGIVERGAEGVREAIAEFAALMNRARRFRRAMTADAARERKTA